MTLGRKSRDPHGGLLLSRKAAGSLEEEARMDGQLCGSALVGAERSRAGTRGAVSSSCCLARGTM